MLPRRGDAPAYLSQALRAAPDARVSVVQTSLLLLSGHHAVISLDCYAARINDPYYAAPRFFLDVTRPFAATTTIPRPDEINDSSKLGPLFSGIIGDKIGGRKAARIPSLIVWIACDHSPAA
ncbi:MAG: hypothetical protein B6D36_03890 [Planctomycetes bacterium UTPLA1]|nr:MAG: hypothetical protein B6D36_03890 [Planctomycetes bacterium UTPLA1]